MINRGCDDATEYHFTDMIFSINTYMNKLVSPCIGSVFKSFLIDAKNNVCDKSAYNSN